MAMRRDRRSQPRREERSEFDRKLLDVRRVARVVAGGRRFSFRATVVIGNRRGKVGVGVAKGQDVSIAQEKAVARAKKHILVVPITKEGSIAHEVRAKYAAARVILRPRPAGSGIIAGGSVRAVVELAGITNLSGKIVSRTPNKLTNAMATLAALTELARSKTIRAPAPDRTVEVAAPSGAEGSAASTPETTPHAAP